MPFCPLLEHSVIVACNRCPLGLAVKTGELTVRESPGASVSRVSDSLQPFRLIKPSVYCVWLTSVSRSRMVNVSDRKETPPRFSKPRSTHQPVPVQLSSPSYAISNAGEGVAVGGGGGGVRIGRMLVSPTTVAYRPHSQQVAFARSGLRITQ